MSCTVRPEGRMSAFSAFGTIPRLALTISAPLELYQFRVIDRLTGEFAQSQFERRIVFGSIFTKAYDCRQYSSRLRNLPIGRLVLVYFTRSKRCKLFFKCIWKMRETIVVDMGQGRRMFLFSYVKPFMERRRLKNLSKLLRREISRKRLDI